MEFGLFEKIVNELSDRGFTGTILPFLHGEPLLVPDYVDYLRLIRSKVPNATVVIFTNGSKLNEELAATIIEEDLLDGLVISFDGGTKEVYESVRRNLSFDNVRKNAHYFVNCRNRALKKKPGVEINVVVSPKNCDSINALRDEFPDVDKINLALLFNYAGQLENGPEISPRRIGRLRGFLTKSNYCDKLRDYISILVTGDVCLCCFDHEGKELLGNVTQNSIAEVWLGDEFNKTRNSLQKRDFSALPLCSNCSYIDYDPMTQSAKRILLYVVGKYPRLAGNFGAKLFLLFSSRTSDQ